MFCQVVVFFLTHPPICYWRILGEVAERFISLSSLLLFSSLFLFLEINFSLGQIQKLCCCCCVVGRGNFRLNEIKKPWPTVHQKLFQEIFIVFAHFRSIHCTTGCIYRKLGNMIKLNVISVWSDLLTWRRKISWCCCLSNFILHNTCVSSSILP